MRDRQPTVYIVASSRHGTLYTGVTSDLPARIWQHRTSVTPGFSARHGTRRLVFFERHEDMASAILREKRIKKWLRDWKINLIEAANPHWDDLAVTILGFPPIIPSSPRRRGSMEAERINMGVSSSMGPRLRGDDGGGM